MICPYCGGLVPGDTTICPDCQEDLAGLARRELAAAIHYNEALSAARENRLAEALYRLQAAIALDGGFVPAHRLLAKVYARRGMWAEARACAARALSLAPDDRATAAVRDAIESASRSAHPAGSEPMVHTLGDRQAAPPPPLPPSPRATRGAHGFGVGLVAAVAALLSGRGARRD
jgi:tetratricopeptide (TPR) repeat protein